MVELAAQPASQLAGHARFADDAPDDIAIDRMALAGAVEIDQVEVGGAQLDPAPGDGDRVGVEDRFLGIVALRSANLIPAQALLPIVTASTILTVVSMAALGLGVDIRTVSKAGGPVTTTVILSLLALGSVSFALHAAGLLNTPEDSTQLESYGAPGPGRYITVYADAGHAFMVVAGRAFDTANFGGPNIPAGSGPRWRSDPLGNLADGGNYVVRHPAGL